MPELPEVETIRRGLKGLILNKKVVQVEVLFGGSFKGKKEDIIGRKVVNLRRRGKALMVDFEGGKSLMMHLRMTGQVIYREGGLEGDDGLGSNGGFGGDDGLEGDDGFGKIDVVGRDGISRGFAGGHPSDNFIDELPNKQTRVWFLLKGEDKKLGRLFFNDQRKFGFCKVIDTNKVEEDSFIASLGKEPWEMGAEELMVKMKGKKTNIKAFLLDQKNIAGLGNIYVDETLFLAGIHPESVVGSLGLEEVKKILIGARESMEKSLEAGGSTMATYVKADGSKGDYLELFAKVFGWQGKKCERCGGEIVKKKVAGRGTHLCSACQKLYK